MTLVACRVEKGKMVKTSEDHNFLFGTQNWEDKSRWKGVEEDNSYINPKN